MNLKESVKSVLVDNYSNFKGRASRSEFWYFVLASSLLFAVPDTISLVYLCRGEVTTSILFSLFELLIFVPMLALIIRRLHDVGKSGWYILVSLIPIVGGIITFVWFVTPGQPFENRWGDVPEKC